MKTVAKTLLCATIVATTLITASPADAERTPREGVNFNLDEALHAKGMNREDFIRQGEAAKQAGEYKKQHAADPNFGWVRMNEGKVIVGTPNGHVPEDLPEGWETERSAASYTSIKKLTKTLEQLTGEVFIPGVGETGEWLISTTNSGPEEELLKVIKEASRKTQLPIGAPEKIRFVVSPAETRQQEEKPLRKLGAHNEPVGAGDYLITENNTGDNTIELCTTAAILTASGKNYALTAGHCGAVKNQPVYPSIDDMNANTPMGNFVYSSYGEGVVPDVGLVEMTTPATGYGQGAPFTGVASVVAGAPVCSTGGSTGVQCGKVLNDDGLSIIDTGDGGGNVAVRGFSTSADGKPGDSGGSFITGNNLVGLVSSGLTTGDEHVSSGTNVAYAIRHIEQNSDIKGLAVVAAEQK